MPATFCKYGVDDVLGTELCIGWQIFVDAVFSTCEVSRFVRLEGLLDISN
jgi:hypothetical protein